MECINPVEKISVEAIYLFDSLIELISSGKVIFINIVISISYRFVSSGHAAPISCACAEYRHHSIVHNLFTDLHFREQKRGGLSLSSPKF